MRVEAVADHGSQHFLYYGSDVLSTCGIRRGSHAAGPLRLVSVTHGRRREEMSAQGNEMKKGRTIGYAGHQLLLLMDDKGEERWRIRYGELERA